MPREDRSDTRYDLLLIFWLCIPVLLYCIPLDSVIEGHTICLYKNLFGRECCGCGMTRSFFSLLHFHFQEAWEYNRLIIAVAPLLLYIYIRGLVEILRRRKVHQNGKTRKDN